jgi:hypothetical protein
MSSRDELTTVAVAGCATELNETYFGAGNPSAAGASKDDVYTWLHQDIGFNQLCS